MDVSLEMVISYFFLVVVFLVDLGDGQKYDCPELSCGSSGLPIRFPFRLNSQPEYLCGYPGFNLSCTHRNETVLELPNSVKLFVTRIDYVSQDYKNFKPTRYSYADIKRITSGFTEKLGQGTYGTVFKGKLSNEIHVAVKILNPSKGNGEEFINEVGTIGKIHHVNVVRLVGFCADGFRRALVYEFLPNNSLEKFIGSADTNNCFLGWEKLQDIAIGIGKELNIFTKLCSKDQSLVSMTTIKGTMGYIAPEVFSRNFGNVSYKADVYSFGMLLLEIVGGRKNTDLTLEKKSQVYFPEWIYNLLEQKDDLRLFVEDDGDAEIAKKLAVWVFGASSGIQWIVLP
ncbi:hypothetical protein CJ030_MR0G014421 [Morella rubra]|uniref:Protein kinase domain-containing protein n=1 Tax=Morella rubra TaxID=262757 RepID=A0A6A1UHT4_9ROSI|nr:hypothetical protein CJ030_MR0G014421 [Morella rubra]